MSNTPQVVDGEASESDSEIEIAKPTDVESLQRSIVQASVISGEASESEDEERPVKSQSPPPLAPLSSNHLKKCSNSILHHRLWEVNVSMRKNIEVLGLHTVKIINERMTSLNKELLALQESIRVADNQVTLARARSRQIQDQLKNCNLKTALPTVRIE